MRNPLPVVVAVWSCAAASAIASDGAATPSLADRPFLVQQTVWAEREGGLAVHHVHGLVVTTRGTVLALTEGRIRPGDHEPHHLLLKRGTPRPDGTVDWSAELRIEDGSTDGGICWANPTPVLDRETGRIFVFYARGDGTREQTTSRLFYRYSDDDGLTWLPRDDQGRRIEVTRLFEGNHYGWTFHLPGPGHGIQLERGRLRGRLLVPVWHRKSLAAKPRDYGVSVIFSDDHGATWVCGGDAGVGRGMNESRLVELADGSVLLNARGGQVGDGRSTLDCRIFALTRDGGQSFLAPAERNDLRFFPTDAGMVRYVGVGAPPRGLLLLSHPADTAGRTRMTVSASLDDGATWAVRKVIHEGGACYSDLAVLADGTIGLLYGQDRPEGQGWMPRRVAFARFNIAWLLDGRSSALPRVFVLDGRALADAKRRLLAGDTVMLRALGDLRRHADASLRAGPFSVTDKKAVPPSGDKHDYMSVGPYWWPDPSKPDGLPYIRRDGEVHSGRAEYDNVPMDRMAEAVYVLACGWYFTGHEPYAAHAARLLRTWFLDEKTRMNPHLKYGQAIPGRTEGRGAGIIDTANLIDLVDAVGLLGGSSEWTEADQSGLQAWFRQYLAWLRESPIGRDEARSANNHGTWYDAQVASYALFAGHDDVAGQVLAVARRRIDAQIEPDGRQPLELARTKSWDYSVMNLRGWFDVATLAERVGVDLWRYESADGRSIRKALDYLVPFALGKDWPHKQITKFRADRLVPILRRAAAKFGEPRYAEAAKAIAAKDSAGWRDVLLCPFAGGQ